MAHRYKKPLYIPFCKTDFEIGFHFDCQSSYGSCVLHIYRITFAYRIFFIGHTFQWQQNFWYPLYIDSEWLWGMLFWWFRRFYQCVLNGLCVCVYVCGRGSGNISLRHTVIGTVMVTVMVFCRLHDDMGANDYDETKLIFLSVFILVSISIPMFMFNQNSLQCWN